MRIADKPGFNDRWNQLMLKNEKVLSEAYRECFESFFNEAIQKLKTEIDKLQKDFGC